MTYRPPKFSALALFAFVAVVPALDGAFKFLQASAH